MYAEDVQIASVPDIIARIEEQSAREPGGAIAFDGDGTLWSGDIGEDYFAALLAEGGLAEIAREALAREAEAEAIDAHGTGAEIARRIHTAYLAGAFPEERVCEIMTWTYAGRTKGELDAFASCVMDRLDLNARLHGEAIAIMRWARERGVPVHLVSASPRAIVEQAAKRLGFDLACVASATERCSPSGVVEAAVVRPIPYGAGKVLHLRRQLGTRVLYAAFGDNAFDVAMLREARVPVAVRPKPRLVDRAADVPGLVVLDQP